ncbi:UNVERIFIED_CONTAM: Retrovirus-related Pol polyprotein from transposon TNT 1-94 [Sesamum radiatum]|uniref:Retrovirus-related Pol polyprotein from transposon TNT 1-94 n=1 Tax=Sesamum radiatum TaxID=300843 RepID=A0AAW2JER5_SESRA
MISNSASWVLDSGCGAHICNDLQVLQRSRKLSKDEMILRLGNGKAVAAKAVGSLSLVVSNHVRIELKDCYYVSSMVKNTISISMLDRDGYKFLINKNCFHLVHEDVYHILGTLVNGLYILQQSNLIMTAQHKRKVDDHENAQIWHARLDHIFKDRIRRLVDTKSLEIDDLDHLPTCESCLKEKMTKIPFVGQSAITIGLLDLVHTDVCGPLSIPARGGFFYFVTFTDDHSRYDYVYLMRYKSEAFGRFKEYRLEVENQTNRKIKVLRSDRGGEYLSGELIDYLKENGILSQWTPPGTPQLNGVVERKSRTLLDVVRSMMSFTELPPSFWGHTLEAAVRLLNISPSKSIPQTPYDIWHGKPASYRYLRVWGSPAYVKRLVGDKLDSRSSLCRFIGYSKETAGYYFYDPTEQKVFVSRNAVFLEKGFSSDNQRDEVLIEESSGESPHNSTTPFEPTVHTDGVPILRRSTRESRVPERYGFVGLTSQLDNDPKTYGEAMLDIDSDKWYEAMKSEMDSMGSNQARGEGVYSTTRVDFEETYLPMAMAKSIRILLAIAAWYDYEIWQMDVKTAFLNGFVDEEIFMDQPEGFTTVGEEQKVCRLQRSIYGLKQAFQSWNTRFDEVIRGYDFIKNDYDPCVYKKISGSSVAYLVLYVDDILLIGNDVKMLGDIKAKLSTQFSMKDMGEASYILGWNTQKRGVLPMRHGIKLSKKQSPKTDEELKRMSDIPYASAVGSIQYAVQCTRPDVAYALSVTSRYQACAGEAHWSAVKSILKYLRMTKDMFLIYGSGKLILEGYSDASFQSDDDDAKSQSGFVFKLNGGVVVWKISKQDTTADSTTEAEYIAASKAAKEAVWMKNYIQ